MNPSHRDSIIGTACLRHWLVEAALEFAKAELNGQSSHLQKQALIDAAQKYLERKTRPKLMGKKPFDIEKFVKSLPPVKPKQNGYPMCKCVGACKGPIFGSRCKDTATRTTARRG